MTPGEKRRKAIRTKYRSKVKSGEWLYSERYDAYYEAETRKWVEKPCMDRLCEFCSGRPELAPKRRHPVHSRSKS